MEDVEISVNYEVVTYPFVSLSDFLNSVILNEKTILETKFEESRYLLEVILR
jgi:hypothetical protein